MKIKHRLLFCLLMTTLVLAGCGTRRAVNPSARTEGRHAAHSQAQGIRRIITGKVVAVVDGDTIKVLSDRKPEKIRLYGIDAPEKKQAFGTQAKKTLSRLVFGKSVVVVVVDRDRYGRYVGRVYLEDQTDINETLVNDGMAWWYQHYAPGDHRLAQYEHKAREARRGLWSQANPTPPWEFRHSKEAGRVHRNKALSHSSR